MSNYQAVTPDAMVMYKKTGAKAKGDERLIDDQE